MFPEGAVVRYVHFTKEPVLADVQGPSLHRQKTDEAMQYIVDLRYLHVCMAPSASVHVTVCITDPCVTYSKQLTGHELCMVCAGKWLVGSGDAPPPPPRGGPSLGDSPPPGVGEDHRPGGGRGLDKGGVRVKQQVLASGASQESWRLIV